jgi:hypothetical protein
MTSEARETLEKRAQKAILQHAIFRWESGVVIALTLLLAAFSALPGIPVPLPPWIWLLGGVVAEALLIYSSLSDPENNRQVIAEMLKDEFHPERLSNKVLQEQVQEALDYRSRITAAIRERRESVLKDNLSETASQIDEWLESIYSLAQRLDRYQQEKDILERDKKRATARIAELTKKLQREQDEAVGRQIQTTMDNLQRQHNTILQLENTCTCCGPSTAAASARSSDGPSAMPSTAGSSPSRRAGTRSAPTTAGCCGSTLRRLPRIGQCRSNKEKTVRQWFVDHDLIESVLYLPENLFYNTTTPGIVLFPNWAKPKARQGKVFLVDASQVFEKGDPKNFVPPEGIQPIADTLIGWKEEEKLSRIINHAELKKNNYNISPGRYIHTNDAETYRPIAEIAEELNVIEAEARETDKALRELLEKLGL